MRGSGIAILIGIAWAVPETWLAIGAGLIIAALILIAWSCFVVGGRSERR